MDSETPLPMTPEGVIEKTQSQSMLFGRGRLSWRAC
uniref:Uncharacterized protein n=1 Tax=Anguilla anguilla TaxID=7936 RepID=A0A0E9PI98_ANGAN